MGVQAISNIVPTGISRITGAPGSQSPDPLATTGSKIIEQSKQLI
jgi:hypothetical protein